MSVSKFVSTTNGAGIQEKKTEFCKFSGIMYFKINNTFLLEVSHYLHFIWITMTLSCLHTHSALEC